MCSDLSFKFNLHFLLLHLVGCVLLYHYVCHMCVFACNITCALLYAEDIFIDELQIDKVATV